MSWPTQQVRRLFRVVNGGTPTSDLENWDGDVPWATPVDLGRVNGGYLGATDRTLTREGLVTGSRAVPPGSLVVSTRAPIGYVAETTTTMAFNQGCRGLVPQAALDGRYFRYQFIALADRLAASGQGSTFVELSGDALAGSEVVVPDRATQRAIADFLEAETARIDALIAKKRRLVDVMEDRWVQQVVDATEGPPDAPHLSLRRLVDDVIGGAWGDDPGQADADALCIRGADFDTEMRLN